MIWQAAPPLAAVLVICIVTGCVEANSTIYELAQV
jgi:hypothetical protein